MKCSPKFKVRDKVKVVKVFDNVYDLRGFIGTVESIEEWEDSYTYLIDGAIVNEDQLEEVKGEQK